MLVWFPKRLLISKLKYTTGNQIISVADPERKMGVYHVLVRAEERARGSGAFSSRTLLKCNNWNTHNDIIP